MKKSKKTNKKLGAEKKINGWLPETGDGEGNDYIKKAQGNFVCGYKNLYILMRYELTLDTFAKHIMLYILGPHSP